MLRCLIFDLKDKFTALKKIREILKHEELFNQDRLSIVKSIINLEIDNFLTDSEIEELGGENMTPEAQSELIEKVVDEIHRKNVYLAKEEGIEQGIEQGKIEVARNLKDVFSVEEISQRTGLSIDLIKSL